MFTGLKNFISYKHTHDTIFRKFKFNLSNLAFLDEIKEITHNNDYRYNKKLKYFYEVNEFYIEKKNINQTSSQCYICKGKGWTLKQLHVIKQLEKKNNYYSGYNNYYDLCIKCNGTGIV